MLSDTDTTPPADAAPSSASSPTPFALTGGGFAGRHLRVRSFQGREAVSCPFRFDVTIAAGPTDDVEAKLFGEKATLSIRTTGKATRSVHGVVAGVEAQGALGGLEHGRAAYRVRLVPRLWLLGKRKTSRVFQEKTVPEIVGAVLDQAGVPHRAALVEKYAPRLYCVQYQETDLAFVARLLAEEGIFYLFDHGSEDTVMLADSAHLYDPIAGDPGLTYRCNEGSDGLVPREHDVWRFALRRALRPGAVLHRDYDFRRPMLDLRGETKPPSSPPPGPAADATPFEANQLGVYDHHGEDERPDVDAHTARVRLEQHRARAVVARGASACRRLLPGHRFELAEHDAAALDGTYVVASVEHEGRAPEITRGRERVYANTFACVPADVALRPARPERALQQVTETALVVGPEGEEIYTDEHGRVKVQFPWDLDGKKNDHSSCWVRVAQTWAGAGWGFQFVPRIGMEVVVTFVGGDTDRPLVTGCVPNAANVPPFKLPKDATRAGIKTRTTPGGHGSNELSFEDRKGAEEIRIHAQRDLHEIVGNDHSTTVTHDRDASTGGDQRENVSGRRTLHVGGDQAVTVAGDRSDETMGNAHETVSANKRVTVKGDLTTRVDGGSSTSIAGAGAALLGGGFTACAGGPDNDKPHSIAVFAEGSLHVGAKKAIELTAENTIVLQVGKSRLVMAPDRITIEAMELVLLGNKSTSLFGEGGIKGPALHLTDDVEVAAPKVVLHTPHASVKLEDNADVRGKLVRLNCNDDDPATSTKDGEQPEKTKPFSTNVHDPDFEPYVGKHYRLVADGFTHEGTTGVDGSITEQVPDSATSVVVTVWVDAFPTGQRKSWTIGIVNELPPVHSLEGMIARLENLGYEPGVDKKVMDGPTRTAITAFQKDHDVKPTGEIDAATVAALEARHGH